MGTNFLVNGTNFLVHHPKFLVITKKNQIFGNPYKPVKQLFFRIKYLLKLNQF